MVWRAVAPSVTLEDECTNQPVSSIYSRVAYTDPGPSRKERSASSSTDGMWNGHTMTRAKSVGSLPNGLGSNGSLRPGKGRIRRHSRTSNHGSSSSHPHCLTFSYPDRFWDTRNYLYCAVVGGQNPYLLHLFTQWVEKYNQFNLGISECPLVNPVYVPAICSMCNGISGIHGGVDQTCQSRQPQMASMQGIAGSDASIHSYESAAVLSATFQDMELDQHTQQQLRNMADRPTLANTKLPSGQCDQSIQLFQMASALSLPSSSSVSSGISAEFSSDRDEWIWRMIVRAASSNLLYPDLPSVLN